MASVARENIGILHDKITITLEKSDFMYKVEKSLKEHAKKANIPGFRKGMVPAAVVRKMYGPTVVNEEVMRNVSHQLESYIKTEKLAILGQPMMLPTPGRDPFNPQNPEDAVVVFEIGVKPNFQIPAIQNKAPLNRYKIEISDKLLDNEIERIKVRAGNLDEQTEVTTNENTLHANIEACNRWGDVASRTEITEFKELISTLPAQLQDKLLGATVGTTIIFVPAEIATEKELEILLGKTLKTDESAANEYFKLTVTKVGILIPLTMGEELYEKVFKDQGIKDEEGFREQLRKELSLEFDRIAGERLQNEMFELLVHTTPIELPETFLRRWLREGGEQKKTEEEVTAEWGGFEHQLRWQLISEKLLQENGINVTRKEVIDVITAQVKVYFGIDPDEDDDTPWMAGYIDKLTKETKTMDETYQRILTFKLFSFLETQFTIAETSIDEESFFKLGSAHEAHHHHH